MASTGLSVELARRAEELLGDGEWHNYEKTLKALARVVPPGRAIRQNEKDRKLSTKGTSTRPPPEQRKHPKDPDELIAAGARTIVRAFLLNKAYETDRPSQGYHDPERRIRQVGQHRALRGDPYRIQRDKLEYELEQARGERDALSSENAQLKDTLERLRKFVKQVGLVVPKDLMPEIPEELMGGGA